MGFFKRRKARRAARKSPPPTSSVIIGGGSSSSGSSSSGGSSPGNIQQQIANIESSGGSFKLTKSSGGGSSGGTSTREAEQKKVADAKKKADLEAKKRLEKELKNKKILEDFKRQSDARQRAISEQELKRIEDTKKRITSRGGRVDVKQLREKDTGDKIIQTTTTVDRIEKGKKIKERIFEQKNLRTGKITTKTFAIDPITKRTVRTGGLERTIITKEDIDEIQKSLPFKEKLIFNPLNLRIKGIQSFFLKKTIPFDNAGVELYDKLIKEKLMKVIGTETLKERIIKSKSKRSNLRSELNKVQNERMKRINAIDNEKEDKFREIDNKNISDKDKNTLKFKVSDEARRLKDNVKKELDAKGINLQNKLLGETGKFILFGAVQFGVDVGKFAVDVGKGAFNFGVKIGSNKETRQNIVKVIKDIPKFAFKVGKGAFELGKAIGGDKEVQAKIRNITNLAIRNLDEVTKESRDEFAMIVKTSPAEAVLLVGGEILFLKGSGSVFKVVNKATKSALKGSVKLGSKVVGKSAYLKKAIEIAGTPVKYIKKAGSTNVKIIIAEGKDIGGKIRIEVGKKIKKKVTKTKLAKLIKKRKKAIAKRDRLLKKLKLPSAEDRVVSGVKIPKKEFKSFQEAVKERDALINLKKLVDKVEVGKVAGVSERISGTILTKSERKLLSGLKGFPKEALANVKSIDVTKLTNKIKFTIPKIERYERNKKFFWRMIVEDKKLYQNTVSFGLINNNGKYIGSVSFSTLSKSPIGKFRNTLNAIKYGTNRKIIVSKNHGKAYVQSLVKSLDKRVKPTLDEFVTKFKKKKIDANLFGKEAVSVKSDQLLKVTSLITKKVRRARKLKGIKKKFKESPEVSREVVIEKKISPLEIIKERVLKKLPKKRVIKLRERIRKIEEKIAQIRKRTRKGLDLNIDKFNKRTKSLIKQKELLEDRLKKILSNVNSFKLTPGKKKDLIRITKDKDGAKTLITSFRKIEKASPDIFINKLEKFVDMQLPKFSKINKRKRRILKFDIINLKKIKSNKDLFNSQKLKLINKIASELKIESSKKISLKVAQAVASIPPKINYRKRIEGINELRKLQKIKLEARGLIVKKGVKIINKIKLRTKIKVANKLIQRLGVGMSASAFKNIQSQVKKQILFLDKLQEQVKKQALETKLKTKLLLKKPIIPITPIRGIPRPRIPEPIPKEPKKPFIFFPRRRVITTMKTLPKAVPTYVIKVKKLGRVRTLMKDLTLSDARNVMAYNVDNTLLRSAKIIPSGLRKKRVVKVNKRFAGSFNKVRKKLRTFKIKKGTKLDLKGRSYIEKQKYALDTRLEKVQLFLAKKRKLKLKKKIKKRKPIKRKIKKKAIRKRVIKRKRKR